MYSFDDPTQIDITTQIFNRNLLLKMDS